MPKKKIVPFTDLYAKFLFVSRDADRGFGAVRDEAKQMIRGKYNELLEELYIRIYGCNPFKKFPFIIEGDKPENINLDRFVVVKNKDEKEEPKDEKPQTFVVASPPKKAEE